MTGAMTDFITSSGRITPMLAIPTPDLAVPYAAPMFANTNALAAPMKPKNGATASPLESSLVCASAPFVPLLMNKSASKTAIWYVVHIFRMRSYQTNYSLFHSRTLRLKTM